MSLFSDVQQVVAGRGFTAERKDLGSVSENVMVVAALGLFISSVCAMRSLYKICATNSCRELMGSTVDLTFAVGAGYISYTVVGAASNLRQLLQSNIINRTAAVTTPLHFVNTLLQGSRGLENGSLAGDIVREAAVNLLNA